MAVLALVEDLIFRSKLEAAAAAVATPLCLIAGPSELGPSHAAQRWDLVIVDLDMGHADSAVLVETLRQTLPQTPIVGFCSHVEERLQERAKAAGCTIVLPRSAFVRRLPELICGRLS